MPRSLVFSAVLCAVSAIQSSATAQESPSRAAVEESSDSDAGDGDESGEEANSATPESPRVRLSDTAELDRVVSLYRSGSYHQCSGELAVLLDPSSEQPFQDTAIIEQGRLYLASCALLAGRREEARRVLREALQENPLMTSPDSLTFPPPLIGLFLEVRDEVQQLIATRERERVRRLQQENEEARRRAEQREYRERELEKLARQESLIVRNSRVLATIPFGVGQFQNGKTALGTLFLVSETLLLGTAITSGLILDDLGDRPQQEDFVPTDDGAEEHNNQIAAAHSVLTWSSWGFLGVAVLGIAEAQLNFKAERKIGTRPRPLPPELEAPVEASSREKSTFEIRPTLGVLPGGGHLGVVGRF